MNTIAIERENKVKSGVSTILIIIFAAMILWLYKLKIGMPSPFIEAAGVEMLINAPGADPGGKGGSETLTIPIASTKESIEETTDEKAVTKEKTFKEIQAEPIDKTIQNMVQNRAKAKQKNEGMEGKQGKENGDNKADGISGTGNTPGPGDNKELLNIHTTFTGRSFVGGSTSIDCHEDGKVVLDIQLLPNGKIIFMDVDPASTGSDCLINAAKEILTNSSFNASAKQASNGSVTFIFKLN